MNASVRTFQRRLSKWYEVEGRRFRWRNSSCTNYQRIISEVLLQRTRAETVAAFYPSFIHEYPSWRSLSTASRPALQDVFMPIGLWRVRADSVFRLARAMNKRGGKFPKTRSEIDKLPAVGQYIGNAIELFVFGRPMPLLDGSVARVIERYYGPRILADIRHDPYLQTTAKKIVTCDDPARMNWAILDLGALVCRRGVPRCNLCPLKHGCEFNKVASKEDGNDALPAN